MKLLIVDDSNIIRKAIQKYTLKYNMELVGQAGDGKAALEIFKNTLPDIVTMDVTMPEMDGLTCLDAMLKIKSDAKIIIISALADKATALDAMEKGAFSFISKPFQEEKLDAVIEKIIGAGK